MLTPEFMATEALLLLAVLYISEVFVSERNAKFIIRIGLSILIAGLFTYLGWWWGFSATLVALAASTALWWAITPLFSSLPKMSFAWLYKWLGIPEGTNYVWWLIGIQNNATWQIGGFIGFIAIFWISFGGLMQAIVMLASMYIHELGHLALFLVNRIKARPLIIFPLGAVAAPVNKEEDARSDQLPWWNIGWLLLAGPTANVLLMALGVIMINNGLFPEVGHQLIYINGMLAVFNLLPISNMDGGQFFHVVFSSLKKEHDIITALTAITVSCLIVWGIVLSPVALGGLAILRATITNAGLIAFLLLFAAGIWHKQGKDNPLHWQSEQAMTVGQVVIQIAFYLTLVVASLYMLGL